MFSPLLRISFLALCISLYACGGGEEEKAPEPAPQAQPAPEKPAEEKPAEEKQEESDEARKARVEKAFRAAYCAASKGDLEEASKAYKDNGFKGRAQFLKTWKFYAKKDGAWATAIAESVEKKACE